MDRKRPSCAEKGEHPAWRGFYAKNESEPIANSYPCDATDEDWEWLVDEYERGECPLVLCQDAAQEKDLTW